MKSIRARLTVLLLLGFALLLGAGGLAIYFSARMELYKEFDSTLRIQALSMAALTKSSRGKVALNLPQILPSTEPVAGVVEYYQLFSAGGKPLVRSASLKESDLPLRTGSMAQPAVWNLTLPNGKPGRAAGVRFTARRAASNRENDEFEMEHATELPELFESHENDEDEHGSFRRFARPAMELNLVIADDRSRLDNALSVLLVIVLGAGLATLLCTTVMITLVLRWGLTPLHRLAESTAQISATSLRTRFATDPMPAELLPIIHTLNDLLSRLEASFDHERRFSSDLAHELRTPIAGLRATAEVALKYGDSQKGDRESFQSVLEIAQQMEDMVTRLLTLARSEQQALPIQAERVPLKPLLNSLWKTLQPKAVAREVAATFNVAPDAAIQGDRELLRGILVNLLVNAVNYTPAKGNIHVDFTRNNGHFALTVANSVDNLEPADLPKLFERFWRKDNARSDAEHTGLGLPLARSFAELSRFELIAKFPNAGTLQLVLKGPTSLAGAKSPAQS